MKLNIISGIYAIFAGGLMIILGIILLYTNQMLESQINSMKTAMYIVIEIITAVILLIGGFKLLKNQQGSFYVFLLSMVMVSYLTIYAAMFYGTFGEIVLIGIFTLNAIFSMSLIVMSYYKKDDFF